MFAECVEAEQSARRIGSDVDAAAVRERLRGLGRERDVRIRTARVDDTVVVVRLDAAVWDESSEVMRRKLTPPD